MTLSFATAIITPVQQPAPGFWVGITARDVAPIAGAVATLIVGIVAAVVAVKAYRAQQQETRRQQTARFYADAVQAVEDYMEGPYRILRKDGSSTARREITQHISDVKLALEVSTSSVCRSVLTPPGPGGHPRWLV